MKQTNRELGLARKFIPKLLSMHHIHGEMPEECSLINTMSVRSFIYMCMSNSPGYEDYLKTCDYTAAFMWHKRFLQALETQHRPEKWLLKDPSHISHIHTDYSAGEKTSEDTGFRKIFVRNVDSVFIFKNKN